MKTYTDVILTVGQPNKNGRVYPKEAVQQMIDKVKNLEGYMLGELYPDYKDSHVNLSNASHLLENLELQDDGMLRGTVRILNTPSGQALNAVLEAGVRVDLRTRGIGNVDKNGVISDYQLISVDVVSDGA